MITIIENIPKKVPGTTSLFINFNYNQIIINLIKTYSDVYNYDKKTTTWEVPVSCLAKLIDNLCFYDDIELHPLQNSTKSTETEFICTPSNFKTTPFSYQIDGINYGLNHDKFLLLDAPGLGKTLQIIYLAEELYRQNKIKHCLIICGINTLKFNWKNEISKHSFLSSRILGERTKKDGTVFVGSVKDRVDDLKSNLDELFIITNIETIRNDEIIHELTKSKVNKFDMIVVDEIHTCKSSQSQQGKNLLKLKADYMVGASGTLLLNNPLDAYVPLKWLGKDNSTLNNFKYYYCNFDGAFNNIPVSFKNINYLKKQIEDCSLRRTKDLLDLPPKNIIHEFIDMNAGQSKFYEEIKKGIISQVDKVHMTTASLLAMVTRLRQATACPSILTSNSIESSKLDRAVDLVEQITSINNKVVIFSVYKESLNVLNEKLSRLGYKSLICTGDVPDNIINSNIDMFQNSDDYKIMLATTAKMGTGITLTAASYAIFIDCPWTHAMCTQCEDRIYRIGSKEAVFIYYLWCNDSIDTRVKEIVETKSILSDWIIDNKYNPQFIEKLKNIIIDL